MNHLKIGISDDRLFPKRREYTRSMPATTLQVLMKSIMSHYELAPQNSRYEVSIGWDPPLANFFLQVRDCEIDEEVAEPFIVWMGADGYATETDVVPVLEEAAKWADIPSDLLERLLLDKEWEGTRPCPHWMRLLKQIAKSS